MTSISANLPSKDGCDYQSIPQVTSQRDANKVKVTAEFSTASLNIDQEILSRHLPLPNLATEHLRRYPFRAPDRAQEKLLWYEGSFDPIGVHHFDIFKEAVELGFKRAVFAIVFQNPYKSDSLPYEHRYQMAKTTMEDAGFKVVHTPEEEGICIFPPGSKVAFDACRTEVLYSNKSNILIGPDNFAKAVISNALWTHQTEVAKNPIAHERYGFRGMINQIPGFREKILVYPVLHDIHSTNIRNGTAPMLPAVREYATKHNLYKPSTNDVEQDKTGPTLTLNAVNTSRASHLESEYSRRCDLVSLVKKGLTEHGIGSHAVLTAVNCVLGEFDLSQMTELNKGLTQSFDTKGAQRIETEAGTAGLFPASHVSRPLRTALSTALFGPQMVTDGEHFVHSAFQENKQVIFVGNHLGWGDILLLTHALRLSRLGALSDRTCFTLHQDIFISPFIEEFIGDSVSLMKIMRNKDTAITDPAMRNLEKKAYIAALGHLRSGALAIFPNQPDFRAEADRIATPFSDSFLWALEDSDFAKIALDINNIVVIPWAQLGGSAIQRGQGAYFTEESPAVVKFGRPMPLSVLKDTTENEGKEVAAHLLGASVASLLPVNLTGVYGDFPEYYLSSENTDNYQHDERIAIQRGKMVYNRLQSLLQIDDQGLVQ